MVRRFYFSAMFEKISKRFGSRATDGAIEGVKETLNNRMDRYSDIIQIGLVVCVIALGGNKLIGHGRKQANGYLPHGSDCMNSQAGAPIVINNYYTGNPYERNPYRNQKGAGGSRNGRETGKNYQKR